MTVKAIRGQATLHTPGGASSGGGEAVGAKIYVSAGTTTFPADPTAGHYGPVAFNTTLYDSDGFVDLANNRLRVPSAALAGLYHVNFGVQWALAAGAPTAGTLLVNLVATGASSAAIVLQPVIGYTDAAQTGLDWAPSFSGALDMELLQNDRVEIDLLNFFNVAVLLNGGLLSGLWPATWLAWHRVGDTIAGSLRG